jgi:hypothetical protein
MSQRVERRQVESESDDGTTLSVVVDGQRVDLDPAAAMVWRAAATAPDVPALVAGAELPEREVWLALDRLGDLGLLASRPMPPGADNVVVPLAGTTRRRLLQLGGGAATAGAAIVATSRLAAAGDAESRQKQEASRKLRAEQRQKQG